MKSALAALACVAALTVPHASNACINGVELEIMRFNESDAGQIYLSEKDLQNGHVEWAAAKVRHVFPNVRSLDEKSLPLGLRAQRVYALAIIRSEGKLDAASGWAPWGNYEWALETLRALASVKPNDPVAETGLAEAQVVFARTRSSGIDTLEDFDRRDLLGSPFAYRALAKARKAQGDAPGVQAALRRCSMMSNDRRQCAGSETGI